MAQTISSDHVDGQLKHPGSHTGIQLLLRLLREGRVVLAANQGEILAQQYPDDVQVLVLAAQAQLNLGHIERAQYFARNAAVLERNTIPVLAIQSRIALARQDVVEAIVFIDKAIALEPDDTRVYQHKADILATYGDAEGAQNAYLLSLEKDGRNTSSLLGLSLVCDGDIPESLVKRYRFLLSSKQLSLDDQALAHFAVGNSYRKSGNKHSYFDHLVKGNDILRKRYEYDPELTRKESDAIIRFFSAEFFSSYQPRNNSAGRKIVFIVGMPRSGSTLIEQMLAQHSGVNPTGESGLLSNALNHLAIELKANVPFPQLLDDIGLDAWTKISDYYLEGVRSIACTGLITDKTLTNYLLIGLISLLFPNAKIIHARRHAVATCYSCYSRVFDSGAVTYSYSLDHLAAVYREYLRLMSHWESVLPGRIHTVHYQELVKEPEYTARKLMEYCELPWEPECLDFHQSDRGIFTASNMSVKKPLYFSALDSWRSYRDYLGPILDLED